MVEAAGIEPYLVLFEKRGRRATFVVSTGEGNELDPNSLSPPVPWSPHESSPVVERYWKAAGHLSRRLVDSRGSTVLVDLPSRWCLALGSVSGHYGLETLWPSAHVGLILALGEKDLLRSAQSGSRRRA